MATLSEIKAWFKTGLKPSQIHFWLAWDSFWHKEEGIPQANILDLETDLSNKANQNGGNVFTGKQTIEGNLELKGAITKVFEGYIRYGEPELDSMYFGENNLMPEHPEFDELFFFTVAPDSFDINIQSETITVRLSVDGNLGDYVFTKNESFDATTGYGPMWTMPALTGYTSISLEGAYVNQIAPSIVKLNLPTDKDDVGKFLYDNVVQVQPNGTLKAVLPPIPNINTVLTKSGNSINTNVSFWSRDDLNRHRINGEGSFIGYNVYDKDWNGRFGAYTVDGMHFNTYPNNPTYKYDVEVVPNKTQANTNRVEVVLPKKDGHLPVKSELPALMHRTIATTATALNDQQLLALITPLDNTGGDYKALHTTLVYNGTTNATWMIPVESFGSYRYTIINNTGYAITINRAGITTFWVGGMSNTSVTIPANGWAEIVGSEKENRFYFRIF